MASNSTGRNNKAPLHRRDVIDARGSIDSRTFDETRQISAYTTDSRDRSKVIMDSSKDALPDQTRWHSHSGEDGGRIHVGSARPAGTYSPHSMSQRGIGLTNISGATQFRGINPKPRVSTPIWLKIIIFVGVVLIIVLIVNFAMGFGNEPSTDSQSAGGDTQIQGAEDFNVNAANVGATANAQTVSAVQAQPTSITVTFAGDCTLGTDEAFDYDTSLNAYYYDVADPTYFLRNVADLFRSDDLTVVNMEGTFTESTDRQDKTFAFKGPAEFSSILSSSSVETASLANNHSRDYGEQSYQDTIQALDAAGITSFGYDRIAYLDVKGVKVALIGTYELDQGLGIQQEMVNNINAAKAAGAQLIMVYVHWGIETETVPNETQIQLGHAAIDAGADLVVGSHPHVIQGYEKYNGRYIVYSLGNFCFGGNSNPSDKDAMMFQQTFNVTPQGVEQNDNVSFIACSISSADSYNNYQPTIAEGDEKARIDAKIQESTNAIAAITQPQA